MGFSRQEYQSRLPCPPPEDLPDPGIKSMSLMSSALAGGFFTPIQNKKLKKENTTQKLKKKQGLNLSCVFLVDN